MKRTRWPDMLPKIEQMVRDADAGTRNVRDALSTLDAQPEAVTRSVGSAWNARYVRELPSMSMNRMAADRTGWV